MILRKETVFGVVLYIIMIFPITAHYMEKIMVVHMLVQLPLLIFVGWLLGAAVIRKLPSFFFRWNQTGIPGMVLVVFITTYWMFPRAMDEALSLWYVELFKFISLPLVGILLKDSWGKIKTIGKSFVFLNYLSMFGLMGWLYVDSPIQLCNNYLEIEQQVLGGGFLLITGMMVLYIIQIAFTDRSESSE